MTHQIIVLDGGGIIQRITEALKPWLGPAANYCNYIPIVESTLGYMLHGQVLYPASEVSNMIQSYGIPFEPAESIVNDIELFIEDTLLLAIGENMFDLNYAWDIRPNADIYLTIIPPSFQNVNNSDNADWLDSIRKGIAAGDYYPEHLRRLVGC